MDQLYLENLEEYINEEMKIVSYKYLSQMLNICANTSKQMLYHFAENHKTKSKDYNLEITYFISGVFFDSTINKSVHRVCIVCEKNLEAIKLKFSSISSIHIYSIQRSKLKDLNLLSSANYEDKDKLNRTSEYCGIKCREVEYYNVENNSDNASVCKEGINFSKKSEKVLSVSIKSENKENSSNMINKNDNLKPVIKLDKDKKSNVNSKKKGNIIQKGGISSFFKKSEGISTVSSVIKKESFDSSKPVKNGKIEVEMEVKKDMKVKMEGLPCDKEKKIERAPSKIINSLAKNISKGKRKSSSEKPFSKRSRIQVESDSSDEEDSMGEEPIPPTPEKLLPTKMESSDEEPEPSKRKRDESASCSGKIRKLVDKTYEDDDGFIVTKKEYEYVDVEPCEETTPADSPPKKVKIEIKKEESPKKSPIKKKQSSIMSFFKAK